MTLQFDDVLAAICTEVKPSHANEHQKIYVLSSDLEAKLAFDVLIAFGFIAKHYATPGKPSKLYITNPTMTPDEVETRLAASLIYVRALKSIKENLDELCQSDAALRPSGFTMAFVNTQPSGKQLLIQLNQMGQESIAVPAQSTSAAAPATSAPSAAVAAKVAQPVTASSPRIAKRMLKKQKEDDISAGPAVGRSLIKKSADGQAAKETLRKRIMLKMFGNFATSGYATLMWLVVAAVVFSCVVFAKSFICYDFVAKKSTKWYCQDQAALAQAEADRKAAIEERQKRLGLAPVEPGQ